MPIPNSTAAFSDDMRAWRRDLHRHPEIAFTEMRTAGIVAAKLREFGVDEVVEDIGRTGVVGVLHGRGGPAPSSGRAILLRTWTLCR